MGESDESLESLLQRATQREQIARDLHDAVIQRLFATGLTLQSVERRIDDTEVAERLHSAITDLDCIIRDIRATIFD